MPKRIPQGELDAVVAAVASAGRGLALSDLQAVFPRLPRRSLQRRVKRLVDAGRLLAQGRGAGRRYVLPPSTLDGSLSVPAQREPVDVSDILLSTAGRELKLRADRALARRTPVGYRREFLDDYRPNRTFYLPAGMRRHFHTIGHSASITQPAGTYARRVMERLLVDLSWASSRLEGNTYSRLDTQNLIEFGYVAEGKDRLETQMILNHKAAIEMLIAHAHETGFDRHTLQNLHALLADNLLLDADAGGRLRRMDVGITGTVYQPVAIPALIEECFSLLLEKAGSIEDPFEQAFFVMVQLPYLQPFDDVNKRVSRLAANIPLIRHNLAPLSFVDVPERLYVDGTLSVYELNRIELLRDVFAWAYERSCRRYTLIKQALPDPDPVFLRYRAVLRSVVGDIVRAERNPDPALIRRLAATQVADADMSAFVARVINELHTLHEGNIARYHLGLSEFRRWRATNPAHREP